MSAYDLGKILNDMYENAPSKEQTTMIHLFGIKYAKEIRDNNITPREILVYAKLPESYQVEINKGIKLAKYVVLK